MIRFLILMLTGLLLVPITASGDCTRRVVKQQVVIQRVVPVKVYDYHYYSLDPYYQQQALASQILKQLRAEAKKTAPAPKSKVEDGPTPKEEPEDSGEVVAGNYQNAELLEVVNTSCAKCHGATSVQTRLVTKDGKALADVRKGKAWEAFGLVNSGEMPKSASNLDDKAVKLFYDWAKNARK